MASITREKNGRRTIQFVAPDRKRKSIRLGKLSQRATEAIKTKVEHLVAAKVSGCGWDNETARWVAELPDQLADRLAAVGLIPARQTATLDSFIDAYIQSRTDLKRRTLMKLRTTHCFMVDFFGPDRSLRDITPGDADDWRLHLLSQGRTENTVRKHASIAKQFFNAAVRRRVIPSNPFADLKSTVQPNPSRFYFVSREEAEKVLDACPDVEWRLIFALSRFGGLRCPSEHLALRWVDVDWKRGRMHVRSPKTEHHVGGDSRIVPLFPELRPYLEEVWERAEPGAEYVIARYRDTNTNLRTQLQRIIHRAGLKPWPKLFQNLRSTRQTELEEQFPSHVVCAWIGNSRAVAAKFYLQVTDEHFARALQNPVQQMQAGTRTASQPGQAGSPELFSVQALAPQCDGVRNPQVAAQGLEPRTRGL